MKRALICGISGQDGSYLAEFLLQQGYEVWGTSRDALTTSLGNLKTLGIEARVHMLSMAPTDFRSVITALKTSSPDEIYFFAGQSSVGLSFEQPAETLESITIGTLNLLEACRFLHTPARIYHAGSSECFGDIGDTPATESTPFRPRSPYAVAKAAAHGLVANYREAYGLHASNGILFNHESPLRPARFVTRKIVMAAVRISLGLQDRLSLGRIDIQRDWGWAPEYVRAMWTMLQQEQADDYVIASGTSYSLQAFVDTAFTCVGLDWRDYVDSKAVPARPTDLAVSRANPLKARQQLNWRAELSMPQVVERMIESERLLLSNSPA